MSYKPKVLEVAAGGTGVATITDHGIIIGRATAAVEATAAGSAGQVLQSGGASSNPVYSTATYPSTSGTSGNVLTSDGTNFVSSAPAFTPNSIIKIEDDFLSTHSAVTGFMIGEQIWTLGGSNTWLAANGTATNAHPGVIGHAAMTTANRSLILGPGTSAPLSGFVLGGGAITLNWVFNIATLSNSPNRYTLDVGIGDTVTVAAQANGCWFQYSDNLNSGNWTFNTSAASSPTNSNSSTAVTTGWHNAQITINAAGTLVTFVMDGVTLGTIALTIPTIGILPLLTSVFVGGTIAASSVQVDLFYLQQTLTTPR